MADSALAASTDLASSAPPPDATSPGSPSEQQQTSSAPSSVASNASLSVESSSTSQDATPSASLTTSSAPPSLASATSTSTPSSRGSGRLGSHETKIVIAVVCVGAFIGLMVAIYFLWRSEKRRRSQPPERLQSRSDPATSVSMPFAHFRDVSSSRGPEMDKFLPIPKADRELARELQSLGHLVQQHVEDHYHVEPKFTTTGFISQSLVDLGFGDDTKGVPSAAQLATMAANPSIRHVALQHIIMRVVFASLTLKSNSKISLLPPAIVDLVRDMPPIEEHVGNIEAFHLSLTCWRQLSVFLLNARRSERGALEPHEGTLRAKARELVTAMNTFLEAFVPKEGRAEQENHLQEVVLECAKFGYIVFSQPAEMIWQFQFRAEEETAGDAYIVTCPGLDRISEHSGASCDKPAVVVAPELQKI